MASQLSMDEVLIN